MPFAPGNKHGNRNGRPRIKDAVAAALRLKISADERAEILADLARNAEDERVRLQAVLAINDRTDGKVTDKLEITSDEMTPEEYAEELAVIAREHLRSLPDEERIKLLTDPVPSNSIQ